MINSINNIVETECVVCGTPTYAVEGKQAVCSFCSASGVKKGLDTDKSKGYIETDINKLLG